MIISLLHPILSSDGGYREVKMDHNFFKGYRQTAVKPEEILISIQIPFTSEVSACVSYSYDLGFWKSACVTRASQNI